MAYAGTVENVSLFEGLNDAERRIIAAAMTSDAFPEGHTVYRENEIGSACLYIVRKGSVDVCKTSNDGNLMTLAVLREGDFFGEISFFDGKPHSAATIVSSPEAVVLSLPRPEFDRVSDAHPRIGYRVLINIIHEISTVVRRMNANYVDMTGYLFGKTKR